MKRTSILILVLLVVALVAIAQPSKGPATAGRPATTPAQQATAPVLGPQQTYSGTVVSLASAQGARGSALVVTLATGQKTFALGPYWFVADSKFTAAAGDRVTVIYATCTTCPTGEVLISAVNDSNGSKLVLRDAVGNPLWLSAAGGRGGRGGKQHGGMGRGGRGKGMQKGTCNGEGPDMTKKISVDGTIVSFTGGPGQGEPELKVATAAGERVFVPAPYRVVSAAGYTFTAGAKVAIVAAPSVCDEGEQWLLVSLEDVATGKELVFRDADGLPVGGRR